MKFSTRACGQVTSLTIRGFQRDRRLGVMLILAMLASAGGWWWRDFNFGSEEGRFLLNFGLSVQVAGSMLIAMAGVLAVVGRDREDGVEAVMRAQGVPGVVVILGQGIGVWLVNLIFVAGSVAVIAVMLWSAGHEVPLAALLVAAVLHLAKAGVIITFTQWFAGYGGSLLFVVLASGLLTTLGHLKSLANQIEGLGWWLARPVPDLGRLGVESGLSDGLSLGSGLATISYALGYMLIFGYLAARSYTRREY